MSEWDDDEPDDGGENEADDYCCSICGRSTLAGEPHADDCPFAEDVSDDDG